MKWQSQIIIYDLFSDTPNNGEYTGLSLHILSPYSFFGKPLLIVNYENREKSQIKNLGHKNITGLLTMKVQKFFNSVGGGYFGDMTTIADGALYNVPA